MKQKIILLAILLFIFTVSGCWFEKPQDNVIYPANHKKNVNRNISILDLFITSEGVNRFASLPDNLTFNNDNLIISIAPDNKSVYALKPSVISKPAPTKNIIKGNIPINMSLFRKDLDTNKEELVLQETQLITIAKWNNKGNILAMTDGEKLTLYDAEKRKLLLEDKLTNNQVVNFAWSPDGKKLYTEHPNLPNGSIIYIDSETILYAYENNEEFYYKGKLDDNYYYGTYIETISEKELKDRGGPALPQTVVIAKDGQIVKLLGEGRFRSAHGMSIIQVDESRFGLNYIPDINQPDKIIRVSNKYVIHADFVHNGKIAFTVQTNDPVKNEFVFTIFDPKTNNKKEFFVNNGVFLISPDGKTACVKGKYDETIDLVKEAKLTNEQTINDNSEQQSIINTLRLAADTYTRFELNGDSDMSALANCLINSSSPEQWAYFDISTYFMERERNKHDNQYFLNAYIENLAVNNNRASVFLGFSGYNSSSSGFGEGWVAELIKQNNKWYITGLSTFPNSKESKQIYTQVKNLIKNPKLSELKGKEVSIGQIQFWQLSSPHRAGSVEWANYCKVYLKVNKNEEETIYKLVLRKENNKWIIESLKNDYLSDLF